MTSHKVWRLGLVALLCTASQGVCAAEVYRVLLGQPTSSAFDVGFRAAVAAAGPLRGDGSSIAVVSSDSTTLVNSSQLAMALTTNSTMMTHSSMSMSHTSAATEYTTLAGFDVHSGEPAHWDQSGLSVVAPIGFPSGDLRHDHKLFSVRHAYDHVIETVLQELLTDPMLHIAAAVYAHDGSSTCLTMEPVVRNALGVIGLNIATLLVSNPGVAIAGAASTTVHLLCLTNATVEAQAARHITDSEGFAVSLLRGPLELRTALQAESVPGASLNRIAGATWLPATDGDVQDVLQSSALARHCIDVIGALTPGSAAGGVTEFHMEGCVAAQVIVDTVNRMTVRQGQRVAAAFSEQVFRSQTLLVPNSLVNGPQSIGPFLQGCTAGSSTVQLQAVAGRVLGRRDLSPIDRCRPDFDYLLTSLLLTQLVFNSSDSIEHANALHAGMMDLQAMFGEAISIRRVVVQTRDLTAAEDQAAVQRELAMPLNAGLIASVDIDPEAIQRLRVLSVGAEQTAYTASPPEFTPMVVGIFGDLDADIEVALRFAMVKHGLRAPTTMRVVVSPNVEAIVGTRVRSLLASLSEDLAIKPGPSVESSFALQGQASSDPALILALVNAGNSAEIDQLFATVRQRNATTVVIPRIVHEKPAFQTALSAFIAANAADASRLLLMGDAVPSLAVIGGPATSDPRRRRGASLGGFARQIGGSIPRQNAGGVQRALFHRIYHSGGISNPLWSVSDLSLAPCDEGSIERIVETLGFASKLDGTNISASDVRADLCECSRSTGPRTIVDGGGISVFSTRTAPCTRQPREFPSVTHARDEVGNQLFFAAIFTLCPVIAIVGISVQVGVARKAAAHQEQLDAKVANEASASAQEKMPALYRIPAAVYLGLLIGAPCIVVVALVRVPTLNAARTEKSAFEDAGGALQRAESLVGCAASVLPVAEKALANSGGGAISLFLGESCRQLAVIDPRFEAMLGGASSTFSQAGADGVIDMLAKLVGAAAADREATKKSPSKDAQAVEQIAVAALPAEAAVVVTAASIPMAALSSAALLSTVQLGNNTRSLATELDVSVSQLNTFFFSGEYAMPSVAKAFMDSKCRAYVRVIRTLMGFVNRTSGFVDNPDGAVASIAAEADALETSLDDVASWLNAFQRDRTERILALMDAVIHTRSLVQNRVDVLGFFLGLEVVSYAMIVCLALAAIIAASTMQASQTYKFFRAFYVVSALEEGMSRWVPIGLMDMMGIASIHDVTEAPEVVDLVTVQMDFEFSFATACAPDPESALTLQRALSAAVVGALTESGEVVHLTGSGCSLLFSDPGEALAALTDLHVVVVDTLEHHRLETLGIDPDLESEDAGPSEAHSRVAIGVHYGPVCMGFLQSEKYMAGGAFGHSVRTARLLAGLCPRYGASILVSSQVLDACGNDDVQLIERRCLGFVKAGQYGPFEMHEVFPAQPPAGAEALHDFKRRSVDACEEIVNAQMRASQPATDADLRAVGLATLKYRNEADAAGINDPLVAIKMAWTGASVADDASRIVDI